MPIVLFTTVINPLDGVAELAYPRIESLILWRCRRRKLGFDRFDGLVDMDTSEVVPGADELSAARLWDDLDALMIRWVPIWSR